MQCIAKRNKALVSTVEQKKNCKKGIGNSDEFLKKLLLSILKGAGKLSQVMGCAVIHWVKNWKYLSLDMEVEQSDQKMQLEWEQKVDRRRESENERGSKIKNSFIACSDACMSEFVCL